MRSELFDRIFPRLQGEKVARGPMIAADHLAVLLNEPLGDVCRNGALLAEGLLKARRLYHSDFIIVFSDVSVEPEALGVKLEYFPDRNPQPVIHLDVAGVESIDMPARGRIPQLFEAARICRKELGADFPIFFSLKDSFSLAAMAVGTEKFLEMLLNAPPLAHEILETCTFNQLKLIENITSENCIPFIGAPIASGGLIGPNYFRRFAAPCMEQLLAGAAFRGFFRCLHICGEIGLLGDQLADLKLDVLSFEDWHASMWEKMPATLPMGFVPTQLFLPGSNGDVKKASRDCRDVMPEPSILSSGCDIPAKADPKLVQLMMSA